MIVEGKADIRSLWALMTTEHLEDAVSQLARRENVVANISRDIGRWKIGDPCADPIRHAISSWAVQNQLDAVVWTALAHKIKSEKDQVPTLEQVIARLQKSEKKGNKEPREYFEMAPRQIDTDYRRAINDRFGWKCRSEL